MKKLKIEHIPAEKLKPWDRNPKHHNMEALKASITLYGPRQPVLVQKDTLRVIAGHGRLEAYQALDIEPIPCMIWDCTDQEASAYAIADNQLTISEGWDWEELGSIVQDLDESFLDTLGFDEEALDSLLGNLDDENIEIIEDEFEEDVEPICKLGDLWQLGPHRLLCGDSTNPNHLDRLMNGDKARMIFTDPPWNVAIGQSGNPKHRQREGLINDDIGGDFKPFLYAFSRHLAPIVTGDLYCVMGCEQWPTIHGALTEAGFHWSATIIWVKDTFVIGRSKYHRRYEPLWYGWHKDTKSSYNGRRDLDDVWEITRPKRSEEHPTMKPLELCAMAIQNSSKKGDIVLDVFGRSGSTLIASDQLNRTCYMMELDPKYCDVIINRWQELVGQKATLLGGEE